MWQKLPTSVRKQLVKEDREFLRQQLAWEEIKVVLLNGRGVMTQVADMGVELVPSAPLVHAGKTCAFVSARRGGRSWWAGRETFRAASG